MNVLWDFDGTLFDTYPCYVSVFKEVLGDILGEQVTEQEIMTHFKVSFGYVINHYQIPADRAVEYTAKENAVTPEKKPPFPYIKDVLSKTNLNVIMTHKPRKEVDAILDHYQMQDLFTEIVAGDDGFPRKPDPASYRYLHEKYRIDLAVGDRAIDLIPAKKLNIKTCWFQPRDPKDQWPEVDGKPIADFSLDSYQNFFKIVHLPTK